MKNYTVLSVFVPPKYGNYEGKIHNLSEEEKQNPHFKTVEPWKDGIKIFSVLRHSDNSIWKIGDDNIVDSFGKPYTAGKITAIWESDDQLRVDFGRLGLVLSWDNHEDLLFKGYVL